MSSIKIRNFGPIKEGFKENDGWLDVKKVTLFIGNQGSGKSTVAKLISVLSWIEKSLVRGDYEPKWFMQRKRFQNVYCKYHKLENYFIEEGNSQTLIEYKGDAYAIYYNDGKLRIEDNKSGNYHLPQIMYVPAERNFISTVRKPDVLKFSSDSLVEFVTEFDNAKNQIKNNLKLPINNIIIEYDKLNDIINIKGDKYKIRLTESSSGYQSLIPLFLVSRYLAHRVNRTGENDVDYSTSNELERFRREVTELLQDSNLTNEQRRIALSAISRKFNKEAFINIVEEPEQNLFPTSQRRMLYSLLEFNNMMVGNKLIMTTHSPYLINYLTHCVKADEILSKTKNFISSSEIRDKINEIVPVNSTVNKNEWVVYELNEERGDIKKLSNYEGLPSDDNYLNASLGESNDIFISLLELEEQCQ